MGDKKAMYEVLGKFAPVVSISYSPEKQKSPEKEGGSLSNPTKVIWDAAKSGGGISITDNGTRCFLKEQSYLFRTTIGNQGFTSGVHYWEILADNRTEN